MADDPLQRMLDAQVKLQERMPAFADRSCDETVLDALTGKLVSARTLQLKETAIMAAGEAFEAMNVLPWKMHRRDFGRAITEEEADRVREEWIDVLHFVLIGLLLVDVTTSAQVEDAFLEKISVNHDRQDSGY